MATINDDDLRALTRLAHAFAQADAAAQVARARAELARAELQQHVRHALHRAGAGVNDEIDERTGEVRPTGNVTP